MQVQIFIADTGQLLKPTQTLNANNKLSEWTRQVELLGIPESSQIWMTPDGFALSTASSESSLPLITSLSSSVNIGPSLVFYVYDRRLFLSSLHSSLSVSIPRDLRSREDLDSRLQVQLTASKIAHVNLSQHTLSISDNFARISAHSEKSIQNFTLLLTSFESDMLVVKSIPIHPAISSFDKAPQRHGPPFLSDYINEESLRKIVDDSKRQIETHETMLKSFKRNLDDVLKRSEIISHEISHGTSMSILSNNDTVESTFLQSRQTLIDRLKLISELQSFIATLSADLNYLSSSLTALNQYYRPLLSGHRLPVAYGTSLLEIVRRREYQRVLLKRVRDMTELFSEIRELENTRRKSFYSQIGIYIPEGMITGLEHEAPVCEINLKMNPNSDVPQLSKSDLKNFSRDINRIKNNLDSDKSVNSLRKLYIILNDMVPQLDSVGQNIDKKIASSRLIERCLKYLQPSSTTNIDHTEEPSATPSLISPLFSVPKSFETIDTAKQKQSIKQTTEKAETGSLKIRQRAATISSHPCSFPPNDQQIQSYQNRIHSLERLLKEKYETDADKHNILDDKTKIKELDEKVKSQEADIQRLTKDLDLLIEELRNRSRGESPIFSKKELQEKARELVGDQDWKDVDGLLDLLLKRDQERQNETKQFITQMFIEIFGRETVDSHENEVEKISTELSVDLLKQMIEQVRLKQERTERSLSSSSSSLPIANPIAAMNNIASSSTMNSTPASSSSFKPSSALTSMLKRHVSISDQQQDQFHRSRTLSESSEFTAAVDDVQSIASSSGARKTSSTAFLQQPTKAAPTTSLSTISPFSAVMDPDELPNDIMPIQDLKSQTIKKRRRKVLPFASSPRSWFF